MNETKIELKKRLIGVLEDNRPLNDNLYNVLKDSIENNIEDIETFEEFEEIVAENIADNSKITYHDKAMEYLRKNDMSLLESVEIASELGLETKDLNSELLASLLNERTMTDGFYEVSFEEVFEDLE